MSGAQPAPGRVVEVFQPSVGGVPVYVSALARGLATRGWDIVVAAPPGSAGLDAVRDAGIEVVDIEARRGPNAAEDRAAVRRVVGVARRHGADLVHGHSSKAGLLAAIAGRTVGIPSVYTPHAWAFQMDNPLAVRIGLAASEAALVRMHRTVVTVCRAEADAARRWRVAPADRVQVVHTGLEPAARGVRDRAAARRRLGLDPHGVVIAWLGRTGRQKQPGELVALAPQLRGAATIAALGHGLAEDEELARALARSGVHVLTEGTPVDTVLAAADVLLMTSAWEGLPLAILEAMRVGLPVVAYDVGGIAEQVQVGVSGMLAPLGSRAGLADALRDLAADEELRTRMGRAAGKRFQAEFTLERMLDGVERVYRDVAGPRGR